MGKEACFQCRCAERGISAGNIPGLFLQESTCHLCNDLRQENGNTARSTALPYALQLPGAHQHIQQPQQAAQKLTRQDTRHHDIENINKCGCYEGSCWRSPASQQPKLQLGPEARSSRLYKHIALCSEHVRKNGSDK